jgi:hypothetical protein
MELHYDVARNLNPPKDVKSDPYFPMNHNQGNHLSSPPETQYISSRHDGGSAKAYNTLSPY